MAVLIYVINYVKPFEKCNAEMAIILAKAVASYNDIESASVYIPIESIASDDKSIYSKTSREIQRSRDLTYQVTRVIDSFNEALQIGQLPDEVTLTNGRTIHRPAAWTPSGAGAS